MYYSIHIGIHTKPIVLQYKSHERSPKFTHPRDARRNCTTQQQSSAGDFGHNSYAHRRQSEFGGEPCAFAAHRCCRLSHGNKMQASAYALLFTDCCCPAAPAPSKSIWSRSAESLFGRWHGCEESCWWTMRTVLKEWERKRDRGLDWIDNGHSGATENVFYLYIDNILYDVRIKRYHRQWCREWKNKINWK